MNEDDFARLCGGCGKTTAGNGPCRNCGAIPAPLFIGPHYPHIGAYRKAKPTDQRALNCIMCGGAFAGVLTVKINELRSHDLKYALCPGCHKEIASTKKHLLTHVLKLSPMNERSKRDPETVMMFGLSRSRAILRVMPEDRIENMIYAATESARNSDPVMRSFYELLVNSAVSELWRRENHLNRS